MSRIGRLLCVALAGAGATLAVRAALGERNAPREIRTTEIIGAGVWWLVATAILVGAVAAIDAAVVRKFRS